MKANVHVTLKRGVLDPQGKAIGHALQSLGFDGVDDVRQGKFIELELAETDQDAARKAVEAMCQKLLANTVIEDYRIDFVG
jgi:phosphoribosylformylglycinamidine synthase